MAKFIRTATVVVRIRKSNFSGYESTLTFSKLRVAFNIKKNLAWATNVGSIKIWNLSSSNRNLIKDYGDEVTIYAGYERGAGESLLYVGDTTSVSHSFDSPEIVTTLECGDGDKYFNNMKQSLSFQAGTPVRTVIQTIADKMGVRIIEFAETPNIVYENGIAFTGMLRESLFAACKFAGLQPSIQNNNLQIIPIKGTIVQPAYKINSETGMIGVPERFTYKSQDFYETLRPVGFKVNTLLDPLIIPGYKVDVQSAYLGWQGIFKVQTVIHTGDTYGENWLSNLELTQLNDVT